jgi:hypothetical protein
MRERLQWYKSTIEVSSHLSQSVYFSAIPISAANRTQTIVDGQPSTAYASVYVPFFRVCQNNPIMLLLAISTTLQNQYAVFIALANKTALLDNEVQKIKALYTQLWRAKTGSTRDPFHDLDRNSGVDFGLDSLHVS